MARLNSQQLKDRQKVLDWMGKSWNSLKQDNKLKVWMTVYNKMEPDKVQIEGRVDHFHQLSISEILREKARLLKQTDEIEETSSD